MVVVVIPIVVGDEIYKFIYLSELGVLLGHSILLVIDVVCPFFRFEYR